MINHQRVKKLFKRTSRIPLASLNYHLGNYEDVIWLVGDGRSGSTWLSDLINWDRRYREIFEPFHPYIVKNVAEFSLFQYLRPDDLDSELGGFLQSVFSGEFKHLRADVSKPQLFYKGLLVKDVFANLLMPWVHQNIPNVRKVLLMRNPFAVALSKQKLQGWTWMTEPRKFLEQKQLCDDHLAPFEETILTVGDDFIEKQILIWSIIHYVPLMSLNQEDVHIIFYEDLVSEPTVEIDKLFNFLGKDLVEKERLSHRISKPTRTAQSFNHTASIEKKLAAWQSELSSQQIDRGMNILEKFQLHKVYEDKASPRKAALVDGKFVD